MLQALWELECLVPAHFAALFFPATGLVRKDGTAIKSPRAEGTITNAARKSLQQLYHYGYINRRLRMGQPTIYALDRGGAKYLEKVTGQPIRYRSLETLISDEFIDHLLATNDVWVAIRLSVARNNFVLLEWIKDLDIRRTHGKDDAVEVVNSKGQTVTTVPVADGFFRLRIQEPEPETIPAFLEIDLGTEPVESSDYSRRSWERKVKAYLEYFKSGKYSERYQTKAGRVLTVVSGQHGTEGERRLANMKELTEAVGGKSRFWFTTFERLREADIFTSPIWSIASREGMQSVIG